MFRRDFVYIGNILKIAFPIILGNLGFILIGVGDVAVAGRHSTDTLAAISLANAILSCIVTFGIGIVASISPVLSNYRGAGKNPEKYFYSSLKFSLLISTIVAIVILAAIPLLDYLGLETKLVPMIKDYFFVTAFSVFGAFIHCASKEFLQAFEIVIFPNLLTVFCILLNLFLNIVFVFGYGPIPSMGVIGLALASLLIRYFQGFILLFYTLFKIKIEHNHDKHFYKDVLKVGLPSSLAILVEFIAFNYTILIMGRIAGIYAAAQNIIFTITSVTFMIPFAISNALSVKIGWANGARKFKKLKKYAYVGLKMSSFVMLCAAILIALFPSLLMKIFTNDVNLINITIPVLYILCFFQIFDGLQISFAGIFRGLKQTKTILFANLVGYWGVAIPLGSLLALKFNLKLAGFWYGFIASSLVLCTILFVAMTRKFKKLEG